MKSLVLLALSVVVRCDLASAEIISEKYPLKERRRVAQTQQIFSQQAAQDLALSWSEDSDPKTIDAFSISVFSTDGNLPLEPSLINVQTALNRFLFTELNAAYGWGHQVKEIRSKVVRQSSAATSRRFQRDLQTRGSTLVTVVDVLFKNEPSPNTFDVWVIVNSIMNGDLSFLVSNLTHVAIGDMELVNVDTIYYIGTQTPPITPSVTPITSNVSDSGITNPVPLTDDQQDYNSRDINVELIVSVVTASCVLIAAAALFSTIRRNTPIAISQNGSSEAVPTNARDILQTDTDVNLFWDVESDIFSVEAALIESPRRGSKRQITFEHQSESSAHKYSDENASTDHSDIFSGIDASGASAMTSVDESPRSGRFDTRSVFSFLSGFASRGEASTVVHSNVTKKSPNELSDDSSKASEAILGIQPTTGAYMVTQGNNSESGTPRSMYSENETPFSRSSENVTPRSRNSENGGTPRSKGSENGTPRSRVSELFTFSEEDSADLYSSDEERQRNETRRSEEKTIQSSKTLSSLPNLDANIITRSANESNTKTVAEHHAQLAKRSLVYDGETMEVLELAAEDKKETTQAISGLSTQGENDLESRTGPSPISAAVSSEGIETSVNTIHFREMKDCVGTSSKMSKAYTLLSTLDWNDDKEYVPLSSPKSLIDVNDDSSLSILEGYETDPGPSGRTQRERRKIDAWQKEATQWSKGVLRRDNRNRVGAEDTESRDCVSLTSSQSGGGRPGRRHTKNPAGDGTNKYQNDTMGDWSLPDYTNEQDTSINEPAIPEMALKRRSQIGVTQIEVNSAKLRNRSFHSRSHEIKSPKSPNHQTSPLRTPRSTPKSTPRSTATNESTISGLSGNTLSVMSDSPANKQLVSDLVWLEKKINATTTTVVHSPKKKEAVSASKLDSDDDLKHNDSLSFMSDDVASAVRSLDSGSAGGSKRSSKKTRPQLTPRKQETIHSIICRDCYAPPGKLKIVIHSTKDGPAVHTVKRGSSLEGHIFPGDLIISVDNVDTRSYSAEQVMKMMTVKTRFERKITVLHFEEQELE